MNNRTKIQSKFVERQLDGMGVAELIAIASDYLFERFDELEDAEFAEMVKEFSPDLLEN
jgi:hypothetical protein